MYCEFERFVLKELRPGILMDQLSFLNISVRHRVFHSAGKSVQHGRGGVLVHLKTFF